MTDDMAWEERPHYGTKPGHFETLIIHFPTSKGVSEQISERSGGREQSEQSGASE